MWRIFFSSFFLLLNLHGENIIWSGDVNSNGTPSLLIPLELHKEYTIRTSGFVNLGKWVENGEKLANDACFEFNNKGALEKVTTLRNSIDHPVCEGEYRRDHMYLSKPFKAKQDRIFFWVSDNTYDDNSGSFKVEILKVNP